MRAMGPMEATHAGEADVMPSTDLIEAMGEYNQQLVNAGLMLSGEGLKPSAEVQRVRFDGVECTVDGPSHEVMELVVGFWMWEVNKSGQSLE